MGAVSIDFVIYQPSKNEKHDSIFFKLPPYRADGTVESLQCFDKRLLHYTKDDAIISYRNPVRDSMERERSTEFLQCFLMPARFTGCRWWRCKPVAFVCEAGNCVALRYWTLPGLASHRARKRLLCTGGQWGASGAILHPVRRYWELRCARRSVNCECLSW